MRAVAEIFLFPSLCLQSTVLLATLKSFYLTTRCQTTARGSPSSLFLECFSQLPQVRWVLSSPPQAHLLGRFSRLLVKPMGWHVGVVSSPPRIRQSWPMLWGHRVPSFFNCDDQWFTLLDKPCNEIVLDGRERGGRTLGGWAGLVPAPRMLTSRSLHCPHSRTHVH